MFLFAVIMPVFWVGFLFLTLSQVPARRRSILMWMARGGLLLALQQLLLQIASRQHWTLHFNLLGVAWFVLIVAGLACYSWALTSAWRQTRRQRA